MSERIGNILLIDDDYPGQDLYSDGEVEDELLEIAMNTRPKDYDRVVSERKSWPVMYHFSTVRQNILSWYPVKKTDKVLEIGSGCGAVTAAFADRAGSVTCVDLSRKRSLINAWRNREQGNIEIRLGNFQDVEKKLDTDYDLITLIGVFEYGSGYIASDEPYEDFLRIVGRHLAPGGRILIAIENRLGMKYFAGCTEDHTGRFFDGIENYPETSYVKTFSREGLLKIFDAAGFPVREFRYPYPDYKFPMSIYSDTRLPGKGELRTNMVNYDRKRLALFDETKAYDALLPEEYPVFSNSFFVTLGKEETDENTPEYIKYSNDRGPAYAIRTEIMGGAGASVRKTAMYPEGRQHIRRMAEAEEQLNAVFSGTKFAANRCTLTAEGDAAEFEYLSGMSLEELFDRDLGDPEKLAEDFRQYFNEIDRTASARFCRTEAFSAIFGKELPEGDRPAPAVSDIDLVLNNVIAADGKWHVIDYEWTFPFAVPADYIKWRVIHYYIQGNSRRTALDPGMLYEASGIRRSDIPYFTKMEEHFQKYIAQDARPLWELYPEVSEGAVSLSALLSGAGDETYGGTAAAYFDRGAGFTEDDSVRVPIGADGSCRMELPAAGLRMLRIDPGEVPAYVTLGDVYAGNVRLKPDTFLTNGFTQDHVHYCFADADPQILIPSLPEGTKRVSLSFCVRADASGMREGAGEVLKLKDDRIRYLEDRVEGLQQTNRNIMGAVEAIRNNRAVKLYRSARGSLNKSDPFAAVRPELTNHVDVHLTLDRRAYQPEGIHLMGWFYDPAYRGESIVVCDGTGKELETEIKRIRRADVDAALSIIDGRFTGFNILIRYDQLEPLPLSIRVENPRGVLTLPLDIETDPLKRREKRRRVLEGTSGDLLPVTKEYDEWSIDRNLRSSGTLHESFPAGKPLPLVSIAVPLYRTPVRFLRELIDSVRSQTYGNWELCLADGSPRPRLKEWLQKAYPNEGRIRYRYLDANLGIAGNTNEAIGMAGGEILVLADHDDTLAPEALSLIVSAFLKDDTVDVVYTDEDKLTASGHFLYDPNFKPDYNPDYLCSNNYICHLFAVRMTLAKDVGLLRDGFDGAQDYDFILRCCEKARGVRHIPAALYHWRAHPDSTAGNPESKKYAWESGRRALMAHYERLGVRASVSATDHPGHYRTKYEVEGEPLISILIPNRDQAGLLRGCVSSIFARSTWRHFEILILENGSASPETFDLYKELTSAHPEVKVLTWDHPYSFSAVNNWGAEQAKGDYLLFLNNDTEVITPDWMEEMLGYCQRPDTGCVGAYLEYPDHTIQHTGVIVGIGGAAAHMFGGMDVRDYPGGGRCFSAQDLSAMTGACMMTKRELFLRLGGFDEELPIAYNDVDYCLKVRAEGLLVALSVYAQLVHYESKSRGLDALDEEKSGRLMREAEYLRGKWPEIFEKGDPYYNRNLTQDKVDFSLRELE